MPESVIPGPVSEDTQIREATCIHTNKIYDSCQSKDCMEDLLLYPTTGSQAALDDAQSLKSGRAELLYVSVDVEPVGLNQGFYTVDCTYFYRITADAYASSCSRPNRVAGLATFSKRSMLFGSQGAAKTFTSDQSCSRKIKLAYEDNLPTAVVEAVDPTTAKAARHWMCRRPFWTPSTTRFCSAGIRSGRSGWRWGSSPSSVWSGILSCSSPSTTTACPIPNAIAAAPATTPASCSSRWISRSMSSFRPPALTASIPLRSCAT